MENLLIPIKLHSHIHIFSSLVKVPCSTVKSWGGICSLDISKEVQTKTCYNIEFGKKDCIRE